MARERALCAATRLLSGIAKNVGRQFACTHPPVTPLHAFQQRGCLSRPCNICFLGKFKPMQASRGGPAGNCSQACLMNMPSTVENMPSTVENHQEGVPHAHALLSCWLCVCLWLCINLWQAQACLWVCAHPQGAEQATSALINID